MGTFRTTAHATETKQASLIMNSNFLPLIRPLRLAAILTALLGALILPRQLMAQVSLVSVAPNYNATGVPVAASLVFTFSKPMDDTSLIILPNNPLFSGSISFSANVTATSFTPTSSSVWMRPNRSVCGRPPRRKWSVVK